MNVTALAKIQALKKAVVLLRDNGMTGNNPAWEILTEKIASLYKLNGNKEAEEFWNNLTK